MGRKTNKELIEWVLFALIIGSAWIFGWHKPLISTIQAGILKTGVLKPKFDNYGKLSSYDFKLEDLNGNHLSLNEHRGEVLFINFWATWCPPCIAEMPDIHQLYDEFSGKVTFLMISLDENEEKARSFIRKNDYQFPVYFQRSAILNELASKSIPTTYVIDKGGQIVMKNSGMAKYNSKEFKKSLEAILN